MRRVIALTALSLALGLFSAAGAGASSVCNQMGDWLREGGGSQSGLYVVDVESGQPLCAWDADAVRPLASNMKLFTTATALSRLGPNFHIATKLFAAGRIEDGTLEGNLYLQGGGDPALGTPAFYNSYLAGLGTNLYALKAQVRAAGIDSVSGRLYADDTIFDRKRGVADSGYSTSPYIGPLSGLAFNSGFSGATAASGFSSDPAKLAASKLARALGAGGVAIKPQVGLAKTPFGAVRVGVLRSPSLSEIVNTTDVYSDNFFAETLLKLLGARLGAGGSTAAGAAVVEDFAADHDSGVHAVDGSGLTRSNRASPREVVELLLAMREEEVGDEFIQDLALSGHEGTLADRTRGSAAYGRCRAKTGTLTGVSNLSGYCFNSSGRVIAFSVLMGGVRDLGLAHADQDRIAAAVASY